MPSSPAMQPFQARASGLVDVLDRVLDKGLVIAGDVKVSIAEVELLTIRIRLLVCSIDKAQEVGLDWWKHDRHLSVGSQQPLALENAALRERSPCWNNRAAVAAPRAARRIRARTRSGRDDTVSRLLRRRNFSCLLNGCRRNKSDRRSGSRARKGIDRRVGASLAGGDHLLP